MCELLSRLISIAARFLEYADVREDSLSAFALGEPSAGWLAGWLAPGQVTSDAEQDGGDHLGSVAEARPLEDSGSFGRNSGSRKLTPPAK